MSSYPRPGRRHPACLATLLLLALLATGRARAGATSYLPLSLAPEVEARIERLLVLAGVPVMTRPIRVATVVDALSSACPGNRSLCRQVRHDLAPYLAPVAVTGLGLEVAAAQSNSLTQPDQHGAPMNSAWQAYASAFGRLGEHSLVSLGAVGNSERVTPTGTMASIGWDAAQIDVGYRDHWWSPFRLGSMLVGTEAPTMPSVTISSVEPLTRAHLRYELFLGRMSYSNRIASNGGYTAGDPRLFGFHIDLEPAPGWTLGVSRTMQFGGGDRPSGIKNMVKAFFNPATYDNCYGQASTCEQFGNEQVAFSSDFVLPVRFPMSTYIEYAAEDTFHSENLRFGSSALSAGFYLPRVLPNLQLRYEFSEWQSNWYVHHIYQSGMTNYGVVLGQWGAQWRRPGDGVGAQSHALELIWDFSAGQQLDLQYRTALNGNYTGGGYQRGHELALSLSRPWRSLEVGARIDGGRDEFGDSFGRLAAFARYAGPSASAHYSASAEDDNSQSDIEKEAEAVARHRAEYFVDLGMFSSQVDYEQDAGAVPAEKTTHGSVHVGLGIRRAVSRRNDFGTRIEFDNVAGRLFTAVRAVDYRHRFGPTFAASFFLGAARYEALTPAYGWYGGAGVQWSELWKHWDIGVDYRDGDHMVRNKTPPPSESTIIWPNAFYSIRGISTYVTHRF